MKFPCNKTVTPSNLLNDTNKTVEDNNYLKRVEDYDSYYYIVMQSRKQGETGTQADLKGPNYDIKEKVLKSMYTDCLSICRVRGSRNSGR